MGYLSRGAAAGVAALLLAALGGCGADDPVTPLGTPVTVPDLPSGTPLPPVETLRTRLLTVADLPTGFAPLTDPGPTGLDSADTGSSDPGPTAAPDRSRTDPAECARVLAPIAQQQTGAAAAAAVHYGGPELTSIDIDVASFPAARLTPAFTGLQDLLHRCAHYSGTDADGIEVDYAVGRGDQPAAGDASVSVRIVTRSQGLELTSDVVLSAVGPTLLQFAASGQQPVDPRLLTDLVSTQVRRLRGTPGP
ncbi:sensor domain-containing protein [Skermania piniformis]|uniref:Sensor domain-containing protein n=1 Tax=Skermania pinensis TaxID=39122 RepID=A0ABX8SCT8_9ACTN|nr:sensor domain-containing protein [Skermania piniformis]QXQ15111.1 sensor domain-containing protein [Skermania piniformis]